jgi:hypothetical protein
MHLLYWYIGMHLLITCLLYCYAPAVLMTTSAVTAAGLASPTCRRMWKHQHLPMMVKSLA